MSSLIILLSSYSPRYATEHCSSFSLSSNFSHSIVIYSKLCTQDRPLENIYHLSLDNLPTNTYNDQLYGDTYVTRIEKPKSGPYEQHEDGNDPSYRELEPEEYAKTNKHSGPDVYAKTQPKKPEFNYNVFK